MKKSQAAIEYLMIFGFILFLLIPMTYLMYSYSDESVSQVSEAQISQIALEIIHNSEKVYYLGEPSKITFNVRIPEGITNMSVTTSTNLACTECTEFRFQLTDKETYHTSKIEIRSENYAANTSTFAQSFYSAGLKKFTVKAKEDHVLLTMQ